LEVSKLRREMGGIGGVVGERVIKKEGFFTAFRMTKKKEEETKIVEENPHRDLIYQIL
jgi:hypothetical protein